MSRRHERLKIEPTPPARQDPSNGVHPAQHDPAAVVFEQPTPIQAAQDDTDQMEDQDEPPARTAQNEPTPPARQQRSQKLSRTSRRMSLSSGQRSKWSACCSAT
jgi:hypothetical protein